MNDLLLNKSNSKKLNRPKYFYPVIMGHRYNEKNMRKWGYTLVNDELVNEDLKEILQRIVSKFEPYEKVKIPQMALFNINSPKEALRLPYAAYDGRKSIIIVNLEMAKRMDEDFLMTHEMFHHFVRQRCSEFCNGFLYVYKNHIFGGMLDEGFTNFLTEQVCNKTENTVYVFPTFVARLISNIIGVKAANKLYISSAITVLREDFNRKLSKYYPTREYEIENKKGCVLKLTPFEVFCGTVEYISFFWYNQENFYAEKRKRAISCVIEMLNYYALLTDTTDYIKYRQEQENFFKLYKIW